MAARSEGCRAALKRPLLIIVIFLLLGAVVNVAVAWGCAVWMNPRLCDARQRVGVDGEGEGYVRWIIFERDTTGALSVISNWRDIGMGGSGYGGFHNGSARPLVPAWAPFASPDHESPSHAYHYCVATARGWPYLSLAGGLHLEMRNRGLPLIPHVDMFWAIALDEDRVDDPNEHLDLRLLPFRPLLGGFALNTIFYAAILWLLIPGPFAFRRFLRLRRGLCPRCAYPIGASAACTECGRELPKRARTT